jgi:hypothetical protein
MRVCERCRKSLYSNSTKGWYCTRCQVSSCKCAQAHQAPRRTAPFMVVSASTDSLTSASKWCVARSADYSLAVGRPASPVPPQTAPGSARQQTGGGTRASASSSGRKPTLTGCHTLTYTARRSPPPAPAAAPAAVGGTSKWCGCRTSGWCGQCAGFARGASPPSLTQSAASGSSVPTQTIMC